MQAEWMRGDSFDKFAWRLTMTGAMLEDPCSHVQSP